MMSAWYWNNRLSWICIAVVHWNKSPRVLVDATLTHYPDSKQSSLFAPILLNAACLAEKLQISILQSLVWPKIICNGSKARKITLTDFWQFTWISIKNAFQLLGEKYIFKKNNRVILIISIFWHTVCASGEFANTYGTCQNCKIIGKVKMETTGTCMWGLTLIILQDIKCVQIWAYLEGIGINFNFGNFKNKIFPLFILRTIQSMHARYHRTLQHLSKIEDSFVNTSFSLKC